MGSPPHTRGILCKCDCGNYKSGITPAHAGNTTWWSPSTETGRDHPRTRGEYLLWHYYLRPSQGSPPHTRGIPQPVPQPQPQPGITPAHAGNTEGFPKIIHANGDHPRTRGEYAKKSALASCPLGLPPHTRGIRADDGSWGGQQRITPAHAGNTFCGEEPARLSRDHPRTRGEYSMEHT